jgi:hypothetical protein
LVFGGSHKNSSPVCVGRFREVGGQPFVFDQACTRKSGLIWSNVCYFKATAASSWARLLLTTIRGLWVVGCGAGRSGNVDAPTQNRLLFLFWLNRAKFDRACECPANGPAWSSMVPHIQHAGRCGTLREFAGLCWTMLDTCGNLQDTAGHRGRAAAATGNTAPWRPNPYCSVMTPDQ